MKALKNLPTVGTLIARLLSDFNGEPVDRRPALEGKKQMTTIKNLKSGLSTDLAVSWGWYNSSVGGCTPEDSSADKRCDGQQSGAYMFRPNSSTFFYPGAPRVPTLTVVQGDLVTEVYQTFSEWATHVVRLVKGAAYVEFEWTAGPIPIDTPWLPAAISDDGKTRYDRWGKELVMKYTSTSLQTKGTFYTDSNGREMVQRVFNARGPSYPPLDINEPIAGNYYPVNAMIGVNTAQAELVVLTDVTQGGASLKDGEFELMVHRRIQVDDSRGVEEPLNETMCGCNDINADPGRMGQHGHEGDGGCLCTGLTVRGRHWLIFDTVENAHALRRPLQELLNFPATLAFADKPLGTSATAGSYVNKLPANVKLVTLTSNYASINEGQLLIRLSHLFSIGEHPTLSLPATVNLADLFVSAHMKIVSATAMSLTGNQPIEAMDAKKFKWSTTDVTGGAVTAEINANGKPYETRSPFNPHDPKLAVTLRPMEVRTFLVRVQKAGEYERVHDELPVL